MLSFFFIWISKKNPKCLLHEMSQRKEGPSRLSLQVTFERYFWITAPRVGILFHLQEQTYPHFSHSLLLPWWPILPTHPCISLSEYCCLSSITFPFFYWNFFWCEFFFFVCLLGLCFHSFSCCDLFVASFHEFDESKQLGRESVISFPSFDPKCVWSSFKELQG